MKEEAISSSGDPFVPPSSTSPPNPTPAASSAGASSPAVPINAGSSDCFGQGHNTKGSSLSRMRSQPMNVSLSTSAGGSTLGSAQPSCRPWERGDLLRRLSTFKPANWFGKPKAASSLACARKGWVNMDVDKVECESCGATLKFVLIAAWTPDEADGAGEEFAKRLDEGHKVTCPWIGNCCAESLVQFPPTPPSALIGGYKDRCDGLLQFPSLPLVSAFAVEQIRVSRGPEIDRLLAQSLLARSESGIKLEVILGTENPRDDVFSIYTRAQKLISLCGWEPRWLPNVQDCEEHSAQSARNGCSNGPSRYRGPPRDPSPLGTCSKAVSRSPLLDCSLCGATVRIWDFLTISRPSSFVPNSTDVPESGKKTTLTRGVSAASGIDGWVAADGTERDQAEDHDEAATGEGKSLSNVGVDLNLTISAGLSSSRLHMNLTSEQYRDVHRRRDLLTGQPSGSEVGDRAASYESRGPSSRKRILDEGGSTVDTPQLLIHQADSVEGTVIDRDGDEVDGGGQYTGGPSKRARDSGAGPSQLPYGKDSFGAGPSRSFGFDIGVGACKDDFDQGPEQIIGYPSTRDSAHVSSVIAMDTINHDANDDSIESVEYFPGDFDDIHLPSTSTVKNTEANETSELNYSNQAQQSTCPAVVRSAGEIGVSSTNEEEVVNADTGTAHGKDGPSFGISGGSVGMGASHEAEIHGIDASIYRADSVVGDVEPVAEVTDNQGQTGEFGPDPGLMGDFVPEEMDREDPQGDSQELMSHTIARADSGSKIVGSTKADSVESGEKTSNMQATSCENSPHPSLSCNAVLCSGFEASKEEVTQAPNLTTDDCGYVESGYKFTNGSEPPSGGNNYDEVLEFDPIKHHNHFCPWVNGNVAAAGCSSGGGSSSSGAVALCGWQLTLDALDAFQSLGQVPIQTVESESAASMYKDDRLAPSQKLLPRHSFNKSHGKN
ncbi:IAP-like protein 1 [Striga hermonthica]|uniref:IAP-like protein 1 n=1 Tax=Striga hermonthica TaxID=68872 RepID=A0A9N7MFC7_STRHE|nr:IAP-like protein 1 [Striga hermonthica]